MPAPTFDAHSNLAVSSVTVAPSPATSGTSLTVGTGEGARFPAAPFNATVGQSAAILTPANAEIVRVTAKSGDVFTITRAQEGTTARAIGVGDLVAATITAKTLQDVEGGFTGVARTDVANVFNVGPQEISIAGPGVWRRLRDTTQAAGSRLWNALLNAGAYVLQPADDSGTATIAYALQASRLGDVSAYRDLYEKQRTAPMGHWIDVPFNAANFTATGGTLTVASGNITVNRYALIGKTCVWICVIAGATMSGGPASALTFTLPVTAARAWGGVTRIAQLYSGTGPVDSYLNVTSGTSAATAPTGSGSYPAGAVYCYFTLTYETT